MQVVTTAQEYRRLRQSWGEAPVSFVPTMGALHEGHLALIRKARALGGKTVVSIFVNPLQFGPNEDLAKYPKALEQDLSYCRELGVDAVFTPTVDILYPEGPEQVTKVVPPPELTERLCGLYRPGHFTGVATVVLKLFNIIQPHVAVFGEKDAQQLAIIRRMVSDLNLPVEIVAHPTIRDTDGLALSSRNRYLAPDARQTALALSGILQRVREKAATGEGPADSLPILKQATDEVLASLNGKGQTFRLEYLEAVDRHTLQPAQRLTPGTKVLIAAYVNDVRLIDNLDLE